MKFKKIPKRIGNSWAIFIPMKIMAEFIPGEEIELDIKIPTEKVETLKPELKEPKLIFPKGENGLTTPKPKDDHEGKKFVWDKDLGKNVWK